MQMVRLVHMEHKRHFFFCFPQEQTATSKMELIIKNAHLERDILWETTSDYLEILWVSAAEIPGLLLTVVLIEVLGRKITMAVEFIGCMVGFLLLFICASDTLLTFFLFVIRAFAAGAFMMIYVYTPEIYPTNVRALGMGVGTSSGRIGALLTPYAAQVLIRVNDYAMISLYAGFSLVLAIVAMLLPIETKGRHLRDTGNN